MEFQQLPCVTNPKGTKEEVQFSQKQNFRLLPAYLLPERKLADKI
jgi:hypothetical protein